MRSLAFLLLILSHGVQARDFAQDFAVVFITARTEAQFGNIPLDRTLIAQAIEKAAENQAKGVVLKFYIDQSRNAESDERLARSLANIPVLLQARIDNTEPNPNPLPVRFTLSDTSYVTDAKGNSGWIPLPALANNSHDICFVDFDRSPVPLVEMYQGKAVKSLVLCAAELAIGEQATITPGSRVTVGDLTAPLDALNRVTINPASGSTFDFIEFTDLLDGVVPPDMLKDKVVIVAYDGPNIATIDAPFGTMGLHKAFVTFLKTFYESGG